MRKQKNQILNEMPYIMIRGINNAFDLGLEVFIKNNDRIGCIRYIQSILNGHKFSDKYGDIFQLTDIQKREDFKEVLKHNFTFNQMMKKLGISVHKLFQQPLGSFKQYFNESMIAGAGGVFGNTDSNYAPGDARVPTILMSMQRRTFPELTLNSRKKSKKKRK